MFNNNFMCLIPLFCLNKIESCFPVSANKEKRFSYIGLRITLNSIIIRISYPIYRDLDLSATITITNRFVHN